MATCENCGSNYTPPVFVPDPGCCPDCYTHDCDARIAYLEQCDRDDELSEAGYAELWRLHREREMRAMEAK